MIPILGVLVVTLALTQASSIASSQYPQVSIDSWLNSEPYGWNSPPLPSTSSKLASDGSPLMLAIPSTVLGIVLACNASYPIEWDIHHEQLQTSRKRRSGTLTMISTTRKSDDINKAKTFVYQSELTILGEGNKLTGNYTCQSTRDDEAQVTSSVYIFWEGNSPPFLLHAGENRSAVYDNSSATLQIPCKTSTPDNQVSLQKNSGGDWAPLKQGENVSYNTMVGFTVTNLNPNISYFGQYKCLVSGEEDKDFVLMNVITKDKAPKPFEFKNSIRKPASFSFDTGSQTRFICCSNSEKYPKMMNLYCDHPIMCKLKKNALGDADLENTAKKMPSSACVSQRIFRLTSGIVRCVGDGIDVFREYFFPMSFRNGFVDWGRGNVSSPYYSWDEADHDKMLALSSRVKTMYVGSYYYVYCQVSRYYFSRGARWVITYKNNTEYQVPEELKNYTSKFSQIFQQNIISLRFLPEINMQNISCWAPEWNTTVWRVKSIPLFVENPIKPVIEGEKLEVLEWYLNDTDKVISCVSTGKPTPNITWTKDKMNFTFLHYNVTFTNGSSTFQIPRVSYEHHGVYTCNCTNLAGSTLKDFQVIVIERSGSGLAVGITISIIVIIAVAIAVGILVFRLKTQDKTIRQLVTSSFNGIESTNPDRPATSTDDNLNNQQIAEQISAETLKYARMH